MTVQNLSYTFLDLYDWLAMVNDCINPYSTPVTEGMLDLVYLYNGSVCCTGVLNGVGYFSMGGGKAPAEDSEDEYTGDDYYEARNRQKSLRRSRSPSRRSRRCHRPLPRTMTGL